MELYLYFVDVLNKQIRVQDGEKKNVELIYRALGGSKVNLKKIKLFHSNIESEFNNPVIDQTLDIFGISRALSRKENT